MIRFFARYYAGIALAHILGVVMWVLVLLPDIEHNATIHLRFFLGRTSEVLVADLRDAPDPEPVLQAARERTGWPLAIVDPPADPQDGLVVTLRYPNLVARREIDPGRWLEIGPFPIMPPGAPTRWALLAVFASAGVAVGAWWGLRPISRDLRALSGVAAELGEGRLETRARLGSGNPVAELGRTFDRMADQIQGLIAGQRETLRGVSHELRTPLTRVRFALDLLAEEDVRELRVEQVERVVDDLEQIDRLIAELLVFLRMETEPPSMGDTDLQACARQVIDDERLLAPGIAVQAEIPAFRVALEEVRLYRALRNLVANALRHARQRIEVGAIATPEEVHLFVDDDGPGIPLAERDHATLPFTRGEAARKLDPGGSGLGLAIARRVAEGAGGRLTLGDSPLGGLRATLELPRSRTLTVANRNPTAAATAPS